MERIGDPTIALPMGSRPGSVIAWGASAYGLLVAPVALMLVADGAREPATLLVWGLAGLLAAGPLVVGLGFAASSRERWLMGVAYSGRSLWFGHAAGAMLIAHFVGMLAWSPVAMWQMASLQGGSADDRLGSALVGLTAWIAVLAGGGLLAWTRWVVQRRVLRVVRPWYAELPQWLVSAVVMAMVASPASAAVVVALAEEHAAASSAVGAWAILLGGGGLIGSGLAWSTALADVVHARRTSRRAPFVPAFMRAMAGLVIVQFAVVLGMCLMVSWSGALGTGFILQIAASATVAVAVGVLGATGLGTPLART